MKSFLSNTPKPFFLLIAACLTALATAGETRLRLVCFTSLSEDQKVTLASRDEAGKWTHHGEVSLRASSVSEWLPAVSGELHLTIKGEEGPKLLGSFTIPEDVGSALVALTADTDSQTYTARAFDAAMEGFDKGSVLILNLSEESGTVSLGTTEVEVEGGGHKTAKPETQENGGYRLTVHRNVAEGDAILCYDRQRIHKPTTRTLIALLPDQATGIRVESLPLFGDVE